MREAIMAGHPTRRSFLGGLAGTPLLGAGAVRAASGRPAQVAVVGDSQAQGLAAGLQRVYRGDPRFRVLDYARISTGLIRLNLYDWPSQASILAPSIRAATAVVMFGANDRPAVRRQGMVDQDLLDNFRQLYGARARAVISAFRAVGTGVVWAGHPVVRGEVYADDMRIINRICAEACQAERAMFVPLWDLFTDAQGRFVAHGIGPDGVMTRLRQDDGVHLTPAGYTLAAQHIQAQVEMCVDRPNCVGSGP